MENSPLETSGWFKVTLCYVNKCRDTYGDNVCPGGFIIYKARNQKRGQAGIISLVVPWRDVMNK